MRVHHISHMSHMLCVFYATTAVHFIAVHMRGPLRLSKISTSSLHKYTE